MMRSSGGQIEDGGKMREMWSDRRIRMRRPDGWAGCLRVEKTGRDEEEEEE